MEELDTSGTHLIIGQSSDSGDPLLTLTGELDISSADSLRAAVEALVVGGRLARLVFDLTDLTFMDSSGIAVMVYAANKVDVVELRHAAPIIRRVVEATGLSEILQLELP